MLLFLALIFTIIGAICLNEYRPDWIELDPTTRERIDPLTDGEKTGGWFLGIGLLLFVLFFIV